MQATGIATETKHCRRLFCHCVPWRAATALGLEGGGRQHSDRYALDSSVGRLVRSLLPSVEMCLDGCMSHTHIYTPRQGRARVGDTL